MNLASYIDHTLLKATATTADINKLCEEAIQYNFYAVCVNGSWVPTVVKALQGTSCKVAAVVGFPLGAMDMQSKAFEAKQCIKLGAQEIDVVINIGHVKEHNYTEVLKELLAIKEACQDVPVKLILETCYLTDDEISKVCELAVEAKLAYVKTSTGFGTNGATLAHVELMHKAVQGKAKIKASGGIRDKKTALAYIEKGVSRIGTSSGIAIVS